MTEEPQEERHADDDFTSDELSLLLTSVAVSTKEGPFTEEEIAGDALEVAARLLVPFVNGDDFRAASICEKLRVMRTELWNLGTLDE